MLAALLGEIRQVRRAAVCEHLRVTRYVYLNEAARSGREWVGLFKGACTGHPWSRRIGEVLQQAVTRGKFLKLCTS